LTAFNDMTWSNIIHVGDLIKFNYQGRLYMMLGTASVSAGGQPVLSTAGQLLTSTGFNGQANGTPCNLWAIDGSNSIAPTTPTAVGGVPYQVFRQPVKSAVPPLQLPDGNVVDLTASGVGSVANASGVVGLFSGTTPYQNPVVTFAPTGEVDLVYDGTSVYRPPSTIYFLIGRRDGMSDVNSNTISTAANPQNLYDLNNLWVSIGVGTGLVATSENANQNLMTSPANVYAAARYFAQKAQSMGGR
jgi:hypothetical protein